LKIERKKCKGGQLLQVLEGMGICKKKRWLR
jgi:hypothetical protein